MNNIFLHIGLGKCASSKLQRDIFPEIAKYINYDYSGNENIPENDNDIINKSKISYHTNCLLYDREVSKINFEKNIIVSNEGLSSYRQPQYYEEFAEKNLQAFSKEAVIILVIRKPRDFLNSIFPIQMPSKTLNKSFKFNN